MRRATLVGLVGAWRRPQPLARRRGRSHRAGLGSCRATRSIGRRYRAAQRRTNAERRRAEATGPPRDPYADGWSSTAAAAAALAAVFARAVVLLRAPALRADAAAVRLSLSAGFRTKAGGSRPAASRWRPSRPSRAMRVGPAMAVGPQGEIAIVWMAYRRRRVRDAAGSACASRVAPAERPLRPLAHGGVRDRPTGDRDPSASPWRSEPGAIIVVAYSRRARPGASIARPHAPSRPPLRPAADPRAPRRRSSTLAARASRTGRTVVAWATQDGGEEANEPSVVRAAVRAPRAARFGATQAHRSR